ncbi:hypothetical protein NMG60_11007358 [Bertholletia excelsa]
MAEVYSSTTASIPLPSSTNDLSAVEEGKASPSNSHVSTGTNMTVPTIIAELVGSYVIIFIGCGSLMIEKRYGLTIVGIGVAWGLAVMVMIYSLGHVSGGHFNSAVTITFAASRKFPWREMPGYVLAQLAGSTLAILTLKLMFHGTVDIRCTVTQYLRPTTNCEALGWEFIISFVLMLAICGVATDTRAINELSGVTVGATVLMNVLIAWNITGASMNPARSIAAAIVSKEFRCLWVYVVAPIVGMVMACMIYSLLRLPMNQRCQESPKRV